MFNPFPILRIFLISYLLLENVPLYFFTLEWSNTLPLSYFVPGTLLEIQPLAFPFANDAIPAFQVLMYFSAFLAVIGLCTRSSLLIFALGYLYLSGVESSWGWHDHRPSLIVQVLLLLPFLPGIKSFSLDAFLLNYRKQKTLTFTKSETKPWAVILVLILVSLFYFSSGITKIRYGGLQWMDGQTLSFYLSGKSRSSQLQQIGASGRIDESAKWKDGIGLTHYLYGAKPSKLAQKISTNKLSSQLLSIITIFFELIAPLILFSTRFRNLYLLSTAFFHFSIFYLMGINFFSWVVLELCLIDWKSLIRITPR